VKNPRPFKFPQKRFASPFPSPVPPLEKTAVQFSKEDDERFDIPTFLRRQID